MAIAFTVFRISEWSLRAPTALIGVADVLLMYAVGMRLFRRPGYAATGALMLAMTPPHFILARMGVDYICPLPFVLGWLWCLFTAIETGSVAASFAGGLLLGVGFFSYLAAWVMMPSYFIMTLLTLRLSGSPARVLGAACVGFFPPLLLLAAFSRIQPDAIGTIAARYQLSDARELLHYYVIQNRLSLYWNYFDPVYLFLTGSPDVTLSTRKAGVFLLGTGALLPFGVYEILRRSNQGLLLLAALLTAPLAPVLINTGNAIQRQLVVVVFGNLVAVYGLMRLLTHRNRVAHWTAAILLIAIPVQFAYFARDYFTDYRLRSANRLDPINFGDVARYVIARDQVSPVPRVYLSESLDDGEARWRFHLAARRREDLWQRTWIVDPAVRNQWSVMARLPTEPFVAERIPAGSVFVMYANPAHNRLVDPEQCCSVARTIKGARGEAAAVIIERRPLAR
jgi:4-amino-4-deoxy-L-arabinose transferase-like glycosyltransferase